MNQTTHEQSPEIDRSFADKLRDSTQAVRERVEEPDAGINDQTRQKSGRVFDRASKHKSEHYERARDYSRENPGKATLIAFGTGIGVGLLLEVSINTARGHRPRMVEPVLSALSTLASKLIR